MRYSTTHESVIIWLSGLRKKTIVPCTSWLERNILESAIIKHDEHTLYNGSTELFKVDSFITEDIVHSLKSDSYMNVLDCLTARVPLPRIRAWACCPF